MYVLVGKCRWFLRSGKRLESRKECLFLPQNKRRFFFNLYGTMCHVNPYRSPQGSRFDRRRGHLSKNKLIDSYDVIQHHLLLKISVKP